MNEICAGLLVYRREDDKLQFLLAHPANDKRNIFAIPKGHVETGDGTKLKAAIRETLEETGVRAKPIVELPSIHYETRKGNTKTVTFFLAEYESGVDESGTATNIPSDENDVVKFFDADELPAIFRTQKPVIESALRYFEKKKNI